MAKKKPTTTEAPANAAAKVPKAKAATPAKTTPAETQPETPAKPKKLGCLDAAAQLLGETGQALTCKEMIEALAAMGYWTSPSGKTPHATLAAAILREINAKGKDARFKRTERGRFARRDST
jgi:hypothetical protein